MGLSDPFGTTYEGSRQALGGIGTALQSGAEAIAERKKQEQLTQVKMIGDLISGGYLEPTTKEEGIVNVGGFPFKLGKSVKKQLEEATLEKTKREAENLQGIGERVKSGEYKEKGITSSGEVTYERIPSQEDIDRDIEKKVKEKKALEEAAPPSVEEQKYEKQQLFDIDKQKALEAINKGADANKVIQRLEESYGDRLEDINKFRIQLNMRKIKVR